MALLAAAVAKGVTGYSKGAKGREETASRTRQHARMSYRFLV